MRERITENMLETLLWEYNLASSYKSNYKIWEKNNI